MFIHFFCLCPLGLATKLNFNISKEAYCGQMVQKFPGIPEKARKRNTSKGITFFSENIPPE